MSEEEKGIASVRSQHSAEETLRRLVALIEGKGIKVFAVVDHSGEAAAAGLEMRPTKLVIFGNPKAGTPVMLAAPSAALDLPLKLLVWEDTSAQVWVSWNTAEYLAKRHGIATELRAVLGGPEALARAAAGA